MKRFLEYLAETSKAKVGAYLKKAIGTDDGEGTSLANLKQAGKAAPKDREHTLLGYQYTGGGPSNKDIQRSMKNRKTGIERALNKLGNEKLLDYISKASKSYASKSVKASKLEPNLKSGSEGEKRNIKRFKKAEMRRKYIDKAIDKLTKEEKDPNETHYTKYASHSGYGFKGGKVLARRSGSYAGGDAEELEEGNPLARMVAHAKEKRHFVGITAYRPGKSKKENEKRLTELKGKLKDQGYGYRKAEGRWEGGKENSLIVHAKVPGTEGGRHLLRDMLRHGRHYEQDSILHHDGDKAHLIGTNESGYPGNKKVVSVGKLSYNPSKEAEFQTELRPSKKKAPARFTTKEAD